MPVMIALIAIDIIVVLLLLIYGTRGEGHDESIQPEKGN